MRSPYVFVSKRSKKLSVRGALHMVENYRNRKQIEHLTCNVFIHTFGHGLNSSDNDLPQVVMLMGHYKEDGAAAVESIRWT
ncbi:tyrosine-type recombinase/integrase [Paenibacillus illinoisensis]|uniref:tyrosine-type recombinase/integrase n=1 Tax=Paenibacillus illinoisensis TaxID=59845 RepID=UPI003D27B10D